MSPRYAVYFAPGDNCELAEFGRLALGREPDGGLIPPDQASFPERQLALAFAKAPSFYGFHATLKAPFTLSGSQSVDALLAAVEGFSSKQSPITMRGLAPVFLSEFIALAFDEQPGAIRTLADNCVKVFEPFRAPLSSEDVQKRLPEKLTEQQREYLQRYGYPFVLEEFKFHMTLSGQMSNGSSTPDQRQAYFDWLNDRFNTILSSVPVLDRLCVYWQPDRTQSFVRLEQFAFADDQLRA